MKSSAIAILIICCAATGCFAGEVFVPVVVTDSLGRPASGLQMTDFSVEGKGIRVEAVQSIAAAVVGSGGQAVPPTFVLFDAVSVPVPFQGRVQQNLLRLLESTARNHDPITVLINTNEGVRLVHDLSTAPDISLAALHRISAGNADVPLPSDNPDFASAVSAEVSRLRELLHQVPSEVIPNIPTAYRQLAGLEQVARLLQRSPTRKALFWITAYFPLDMTTPSFSSFTNTDMPEVNDLAVACGKTIQVLNSARVTVYPLQVEGPVPNNPIYAYAERTRSDLEQFARQTGGYNFAIEADLPAAISQVRKTFGTYYLLSLAVVPPKKYPKWVAIKVKTTRAELRVQSAGGFLSVP